MLLGPADCPIKLDRRILVIHVVNDEQTIHPPDDEQMIHVPGDKQTSWVPWIAALLALAVAALVVVLFVALRARVP